MSNAAGAKATGAYEWMLLLTILGLMGLSLVLAPTSFERKSEQEQRNLAPMPLVPSDLNALRNFPAKFEDFYKDHFGFRKLLLNLNHWVNNKVLRVPADSFLIEGTDGWIFYRGENELELFRHRLPLDEPTLERWRKELTHRRDFLTTRGIDYLFLLAPDKQTIYPEKMPTYLSIAKNVIDDKNPSQYDQLAQMSKVANIPFLDARPALLQEKNNHEVYLHWDAHWNQWGAYQIYLQILQVFNDIRMPSPLNSSPVIIQYENYYTTQLMGDIIKLAGRNDLETIQEYAAPCSLKGWDVPHTFEGTVRTFCATGQKKLLVFRDSYTEGLAPFLSSTFAEVVYVWKIVPFETFAGFVELEKPDAVLEERVERFVQRGIPDPIIHPRPIARTKPSNSEN